MRAIESVLELALEFLALPKNTSSRQQHSLQNIVILSNSVSSYEYSLSRTTQDVEVVCPDEGHRNQFPAEISMGFTLALLA
jgi:hypothetical protein